MAAPKLAARVERTAFRTFRALDFASVEELTRETGQPPAAWPLVILKELVDNALDACEEAGIAPVILVRVDQDGITVADNGPGLPAETVAGVVDFQVRVSSRSAYVAPDRGAQGNALKTLIAMPFVLDGTAGQVEITARGLRHRITFGLDALRQHPEVALEVEPAPAVRRGTSLLVRWPDSASSTLTGAEAGFYRIAATYAFLNPHLTLTLRWFEQEEAAWLPAEPTWAKWKPTRPTSPHWYTPERLARLIAAYLAHDEAAGRPSARTVRDFVALFDGLTGTAKRKAVLDATGLHRAPLRALVGADGLDMAAVARLLGSMRAASKPVRPDKLGLIGGAALRSRLEEHGVEPDSFEYRRKMGTTTSGLPWVVEAAFGWRPDAAGRHLITGVNWSPGVNNPFRALRHLGDGLDGLLADRWADEDAPVLVAVHLAIPGASYTDRGKTALSVPYDVGEALFDAVTAVTKRWARQMEAEIRDHGRKLRRREAMTAAAKPERVTLKDAAWSVMRAAYMAASAGDTLPANARQIYYAARPAILAMTGKDRLDDQYFCQTLLPDYLAEHPEETDAWDVVFDARGHLLEPHTGREVALGTLDVRHYLGDRPQEWLSEAEPSAFSWPTIGPKHRFGAMLFIEKEGFDPLLRAARLAERYDVAIMSTKGMSVTAARLLIDRLSAEHPGLKVLVAHDFDVSGFSIFGTLGGDTRRYAFENAIEVIDIGLRLADARAEGLQDEPVGHKGDWARIAATLRRHGATEEEVTFLRTKRVELNAFTSDALVAWLERKLEEHRVRKIIPDADTLDAAARAAWRLAARADLLARRAADLDREADEAPLPSDLRARVEALLAERPEMPWDEAVEEVVAELRGPTVDEGDVGDEG